MSTTKTITTIQGDCWDVVAKRLGWPESYMSYLLEANPGYREVAVFGAGAVLNAPEVPDPKTRDDRPPWLI